MNEEIQEEDRELEEPQEVVDPLGSYNGLQFWSWDNIPNIILHDRLILFDQSILPFFLFCHFFIVGRFFINNVT